MNDLQKYVDHLFNGHRETTQIKELKEEILSNLEAKVSDLTSNGMEYKQAVKIAIESIDNVDFLIDGKKKFYRNRFAIEFFQVAAMYFLIAWIITIPIQMVGMGIILNILLLVAAVIAGIIFIVLYVNKNAKFLDKVAVYNVNSVLRYKMLVWIIWGLFITVSILGVTAIQFASNIWFSRPVNITGPYQFAVIAIRYALPFISIIVPLLYNAAVKLMQKHEVGGQHEN